MSEPGQEPRRMGETPDVKPHAFDPVLHPELFDGVLSRRIIAFLIDVALIAAPVLLAAVFIFILGLVTLGLGWALYWLFTPGTVIWALLYYGATFGGRSSATVGMRMVGLEMRTWYGAPCYSVLGAVHAVAFWVLTCTFPPVLLVALFNQRRRLLHDLLLGTIVVNRRVARELVPIPDTKPD